MAFIREFLGAAAALFLAAALAFWVVDPHDDFHTGLFPVIVRDTRAEKMDLFRRLDGEEPALGIVIGSSRSMRLAPAIFESAAGFRFFNFAVDNARTEDYLAIVRWILAHAPAPRAVIIGVDVEALHDDDAPDVGLAKNADLLRAWTGAAPPLLPLRTLKATFTPTYVEDTATSIRLRIHPAGRGHFFFEPNGLMHDPDVEHERAAGAYDLKSRMTGCMATYVERFEWMTGLSPARTEYLRETIAEVRAAGGTPVLWVTPLHPATIRRLEARTAFDALRAETVALVDDLHRTSGVAAHDFSDPSRYGGRADGWDDCAHTDQSDADRIAARLARDLI